MDDGFEMHTATYLWYDMDFVEWTCFHIASYLQLVHITVAVVYMCYEQSFRNGKSEEVQHRIMT